MEETLTVPAKKAQPSHDIPYISGPNEILNDDYHNSPEYQDFISSTSLKHYGISPKYAKWARIQPPKEQTPAMRFGTMYHDMLQSIVNTGGTDQFNLVWSEFNPPINEKTGAPYGPASARYQDAYAEQCQAKGVTDLCSKEEIQQVEDMARELRDGSRHLSHIINQFIKNGKAEQSHFLHYQGQGFKYRTDLKTNKIILDWKTTQLEFPKVEQFSRQIIKFRYDISAAMYQFFEFELTGKWRKFYWVVQEKEPPYDFTVLDSSEWTWNVHPSGEVVPGPGAHDFIKLMEQHILCEELQDWSGYSIFIKPDWKNYRIGIPEVPGWVKQQDFNFFND